MKNKILALFALTLFVAGVLTIPLNKNQSGNEIAGWSWGGTIIPPIGQSHEIAGWSWGGTIVPVPPSHLKSDTEIAGFTPPPFSKGSNEQLAGLPVGPILRGGHDAVQLAGLPVGPILVNPLTVSA